MTVRLCAPQPLDASHLLSHFDCGEPSLDDWLKRLALKNHHSGGSRVYVVADDDRRVHGFYALAAGAVSHKESPGAIRRNMPDPIPVLVLGRLAVNLSVQGRKLGPALLQDAVVRATTAAQMIGVRALLVHALHARAANFYSYYGFQVSPVDPLTLMLRI